MISVIIPAYNEEAVIERCLRTLTEGAPEGALQLIVACNGCRDRTAELARAFPGPVEVVETEVSSKVAALNLGEAVASSYPRFYLDADVELTWPSIRAMADELERTGKPVGAPRLEMALGHANFWVRAYYAVWLKLSFHRAGMVGCGVYALTREGRSRFEAFPDLIADDGFVRSLFTDEERALPSEGRVVVHGPATIESLIKIKTRSRLGLAQLRAYNRGQAERGLKKSRFFFGPVLARPWLWPAALVYLYVNLRSRQRAAGQMRSMEHYSWERDESTRQTPTGATP